MIRYDYDPLANQLRLPGYIPSSCGVQVYSGLSCGLAMSCLTTIFLPVSGAHVNPATSLAAAITSRVSVVRAVGEWSQVRGTSIIQHMEVGVGATVQYIISTLTRKRKCYYGMVMGKSKRLRLFGKEGF